MLSSFRERHSDQLQDFRIDGSRLARDNFADVLIDEVISNKVLCYPDSNSKLKVIKGKVSTKNIIPDMGQHTQVSIVEGYLAGYFHCPHFRVSGQYRKHGQICLLNQTRPKISTGTLQQIKTD